MKRVLAALVRMVAIFFIVLGITYFLVRLLGMNPELLMLAPIVAIIAFGVDLLWPTLRPLGARIARWRKA